MEPCSGSLGLRTSASPPHVVSFWAFGGSCGVRFRGAAFVVTLAEGVGWGLVATGSAVATVVLVGVVLQALAAAESVTTMLGARCLRIRRWYHRRVTSTRALGMSKRASPRSSTV